jgi:hypothetical protein
MKRVWTVLAAFVAVLLLAAPAFAATDACSMDAASMAPNADALIMHIQHARSMGHINNDGLAKALTSQVTAAKAAANSGNNAVAASILRSTLSTIQAQTGQHIAADCAPHLADQTKAVIAALGA